MRVRAARPTFMDRHPYVSGVVLVLVLLALAIGIGQVLGTIGVRVITMGLDVFRPPA